MALIHSLGRCVKKALKVLFLLLLSLLEKTAPVLRIICKPILVVVFLIHEFIIRPLMNLGSKVKNYLITDTTLKRRNSEDYLVGPLNMPPSTNFRPRKINAPRTVKERLRKAFKPLIISTIVFGLLYTISLAESSSQDAVSPDSAVLVKKPAVKNAEAAAAPAVKHSKSSPKATPKATESAVTAANITDARDPQVISDYANYLVDKLGLDEYSSWVVRNVQTEFDPYTYHGDAVYPDSANPIDTQSLPSLKKANSKLVPSDGFETVQARGQDTIRGEIKHRADMLLNDVGEEYPDDETKGKTKTELCLAGKRECPRKPGLPQGFVLRWPPERAKIVNEQIEKERKFFEALDKIKEQEAFLEKVGALEAHKNLMKIHDGGIDALNEPEAQPQGEFPPTENAKLQKRGDVAEPEKVEPEKKEAYKKETGEVAKPTEKKTGETDVELYRELTPTFPLLEASKKPLRLLSSGRGMLKKALSRAKDVKINPDENLFIRGSDSFDTSAVDLSPVFFVVSTTYSRLSNNDWAILDDWARFMTNGKGQSNGAFVLVALHRPRGDEAEIVRRKLRERGIFHRLESDVGNMFEGQGGGPNDDGKLPIIPDPAAVRYANALSWANDYNYRQFILGGTPEAHGCDANGNDVDMFGNVILRNVQRRTVFAFMDDDAFVVNVPLLLAQLKSHRLIVDGLDLAAKKKNPDHEKLLDKNMYLAFPSDPYSDWTFHNTTTYANLHEHEVNLFGSATTTANMTLKYRQAYNYSNPKDPWGDKERFLQNYQPEFREDGSQLPIRSDWHQDHIDQNMVLPTSFGGGAVFMAPELAEKMATLSCLPIATEDVVLDNMRRSARKSLLKGGHREASWEEQLFHCARSSMPQLKLHVVPSFYSPADAALYGNDAQSAFQDDKTFGRELGRMHQYTGGTRPIMVHNHRTLHQFDAGSAHKVTDICGDDCFLQRYEFDDNWVLTNGHSLVHFPNGKGPGSNTDRIPRREIVKAADGTLKLESSGLSDRISNAIHNSLKKRGETYRELLEFYDSEQLAMEQATRPPGKHIDILKLDQRHQTFKLLDTSVALDGTVMQAYVRRRDRGNKLFVDGSEGGRPGYKKLEEWMAIPELAKGGLDGSERDMAAEDKAPKNDEVVVLMWEPAQAPPKPSNLAAVPLVSRGEKFRVSSIFGVLSSFAWMAVKVAVVNFVLYAAYNIMQCGLAAGRRPQAKQVSELLTPAALVGAWSSMESTGRNTCILIFIATSVISTYLGSAIQGITYLYSSFVVLYVVLALIRGLLRRVLYVVRKIVAPFVRLAVRIKGLMARVAGKFGVPSFLKGWKLSFSFPSFSSLTSCFVLPGFLRRRSSSSSQSSHSRCNSHKQDKARKSDDSYADDDVSDVEGETFELRFLAPPEEDSGVPVRRQPPEQTSPYGRAKGD